MSKTKHTTVLCATISEYTTQKCLSIATRQQGNRIQLNVYILLSSNHSVSVQLLTNSEHATTEKETTTTTKTQSNIHHLANFRMCACAYGWKYLYQRKSPTVVGSINTEYMRIALYAVLPVPVSVLKRSQYLMPYDNVM